MNIKVWNLSFLCPKWTQSHLFAWGQRSPYVASSYRRRRHGMEWSLGLPIQEPWTRLCLHECLHKGPLSPGTYYWLTVCRLVCLNTLTNLFKTYCIEVNFRKPKYRKWNGYTLLTLCLDRYGLNQPIIVTFIYYKNHDGF